MIPYLIFISIVIFFFVSYFKVKSKPIKLRTKTNSKLKILSNGNKKSKSVNEKLLTKDQKYNHIKIDKEKEVDRILEKIHKKGLKSLSIKEKKFLDGFSK